MDMNGCEFCRADKNGKISCWHLNIPKNSHNVESADIYFDDGITIILNTPDDKIDKYMHVDAHYCPNCGRHIREKKDIINNEIRFSGKITGITY